MQDNEEDYIKVEETEQRNEDPEPSSDHPESQSSSKKPYQRATNPKPKDIGVESSVFL